MKTLRLILIAFSLVASASSLAGLIYFNVNEENKRQAYFQEQDEKRALGEPTFSGPYCYPNPHPQILTKIVLATLLTFCLLLFSRNPAWAFPSAIFSFGMFPYWYLQTQRDLELASLYEPVWFDRYLLDASVLDICAGIASLGVVILLLISAVNSMRLVFTAPEKLR